MTQPEHYVVGLGNPGPRYEGTRHNLGFDVVYELAFRAGKKFQEGLCNCLWAQTEDLVLIAPQTYVNRSGYAVRCLLETYGLTKDQVLIVYDEVRLPLGRMRLRGKGSPGGHRGMESIVAGLQSDEIARLRVGVEPATGMPKGELAEFVLNEFEPDEQETVDAVIAAAADACGSWQKHGVEETMQRFNGWQWASGADEEK